MNILVLMVAHAEQVVTREEFIKTVLHGSFVTDEEFSRCIYRLRQAMGDDTREPRFIETVPKRGYRLIAPVRKRETEAESVPAPAVMLPESTTWRRSIPGAKRHDPAR